MHTRGTPDVKKALAALGATVLGLGTAATGAALPAAAAPAPLPPATEPCTDINDQLDSTGSWASNWFQDCVPQYGVGKAEFTIVPDEDNPTEEFPEGFVDLTEGEDGGITRTSTADLEALAEYFSTVDADEVGLTPIVPVAVDGDSATSRTYLATVFAPVATIGNAGPEDEVPAEVLAACGFAETDYAGWVATYEPIDTTFTQTVDEAEWTYEITGEPKPSYFMISEDGETLCITDGTYTLLTSESTDISGYFFYLFGLVTVYPPNAVDFVPTDGQIPDLSSLAETFASLKFAADPLDPIQTLGTFSRSGITPPPPPPPVPGPALAPTGADAADLVIPAAIAGGVLLVGGALVVIAVVRRRRTP